jgi:hypothetical protein
MMRMYKQGLRDNVKAELMRSGVQIDTLDTLINESIRLDNELREFAIKMRAERPFHVPKGKTTVTPNTGRYRGRYEPRMPGGYHYNRRDCMHIDNMNKGSFKPKEFFRGTNDKKGTRSCYNCGKPGHLARDCRTKKNMVTQQLNALTRETGIEEEREITSNDIEELNLDDQPSDPVPARTQTPHPGNKVPTAWVDESNKEIRTHDPYATDGTRTVKFSRLRHQIAQSMTTIARIKLMQNKP